MLLILTSLTGSVLGFLVCFLAVSNMRMAGDDYGMRVCMINNMSLAFIFAMLVELTTGSKGLAVVLPLFTVCLPLLWTGRPFQYIEIVELLVTSIMSVSMSVMLIGMLSNQVVWLIQVCLITVEILLFLAARSSGPGGSQSA